METKNKEIQEALGKAVDIFYVVCEYNSIEQDLVKILLAYYGANPAFDRKSTPLLQEVLTSKHLSFAAKADFVTRIPEIKKQKISYNTFQKLTESRNDILHGIYIINQETETIEDRFFKRNLKTQDFQEAIKKFQSQAKEARDAITKIGEILRLTVIDGSISLNKQWKETIKVIKKNQKEDDNEK